MYNQRIKNSLLLLIVGLIPNLISAQSLKDQIEDCYHFLMDNNDLTLQVDVRAWQYGAEDKIIDNARFIYTNDKEGFYMKALDVEVIQNKDLTVRLDHQLEQAILISGHSKNSPDDMGIPTWLADIENLDSIYDISQEKTKAGEVFTLSQNNQKTMTITMDKGRIIKLIQHPVQPIRYQGKSITTVVEMNYSYSPARKHPRLEEVVSQTRGDIELKAKYGKYKLIDYRNFKTPEKK